MSKTFTEKADYIAERFGGGATKMFIDVDALHMRLRSVEDMEAALSVQKRENARLGEELKQLRCAYNRVSGLLRRTHYRSFMDELERDSAGEKLPENPAYDSPPHGPEEDKSPDRYGFPELITFEAYRVLRIVREARHIDFKSLALKYAASLRSQRIPAPVPDAPGFPEWIEGFASRVGGMVSRDRLLIHLQRPDRAVFRLSPNGLAELEEAEKFYDFEKDYADEKNK